MAIEKKLLHFKQYSDFNSKKLSANVTNTQYTIGLNGTVTTGEPDVKYQSICWIKDTKQIWTHGTIYNCDELPSNNVTGSGTSGYIAKWNGTNTVTNGPAFGTSTTTFLRNDGTWTVPYTHPSHTSKTSGLYKITVDSLGHVSAATAVVKSDITALGIPSSDTNTTYTFAGGTNGFTVTPSGGSAQTITVTPSIANASTSAYGITKLSSATDSTSTALAATPSAVKSAYDLANSKQEALVSGTNIKTINGESVLGSGDITIESGSAAYSIVNYDEDSSVSRTTFSIKPNTYNRWGEATSLSIVLLEAEDNTVVNEYIFEFRSGVDATSLRLSSDIMWAGGEYPTIESNMLYQISIVNNCATVLAFPMTS